MNKGVCQNKYCFTTVQSFRCLKLSGLMEGKLCFFTPLLRMGGDEQVADRLIVFGVLQTLASLEMALPGCQSEQGHVITSAH